MDTVCLPNSINRVYSENFSNGCLDEQVHNLVLCVNGSKRFRIAGTPAFLPHLVRARLMLVLVLQGQRSERIRLLM